MNLIVRALVIALALTGAVATTHANASSDTAQAPFHKTSAWPMPTCDPNDPGACGMSGSGN